MADPKRGKWFEREVERARNPEPDDPERQRLLSLVLASPDDVQPRLVYADFLMERGDPRGEFVAVQCELARLGGRDATGPRAEELKAREAELLKKHKKRWVGQYAGTKTRYGIDGGPQWVKGSPTTWQFARGFVDYVGMSTRDFTANAEAIFAHEPLRCAHVTDRDLAPLLKDCPCLEKLRAFDLSRVAPQEAGARALFSSERFESLQVLNLNLARLGVGATQVAVAVGQPASFPKLRELWLWENALGDKGAEAIAGWPLLSGLKRLELGHNGIGPRGATALARSPHLDGIERLSLFANDVGDAAGAELRERFGRSHRAAVSGRGILWSPYRHRPRHHDQPLPSAATLLPRPRPRLAPLLVRSGLRLRNHHGQVPREPHRGRPHHRHAAQALRDDAGGQVGLDARPRRLRAGRACTRCADTTEGHYDPTSTNPCKWNDLKAALASRDPANPGFLVAGKDIAAYGLAVFPGGFPRGESCETGMTLVGLEPGADHVDHIIDQLDVVSPGGGTPTAAMLELVSKLTRLSVEEPGRKRFVMLLTDGEPNCSQTPTNVTRCQECNSTKDCEGAGRCNPTFHGTTSSAPPCLSDTACLDDTGLIEQITALRAKGVDTFIIWFGSASAQPFAAKVLNDAAVAGGRPRPGATTKYWDAASRDELRALLKDISKSLQTCTFTLDPAPTDQDILEVTFVDKANDDAETTLNKGTDYTLSADGTVEILGDRCKQIQEAAPGSLNVLFQYVN
ncbi:MAG: TIGR02996 domain-containing protein [Myxococcales bacterium]